MRKRSQGRYSIDVKHVVAAGAVSLVVALSVPLISITGPLAATALAGSCTDTWTNSAGGAWDTASDWSSGVVPKSTDTACITASGTYTVILGNETINIAGLEIGGSGSTPELQIGNSGSNFPYISVTGTVAIAAGSTLSYGWGGSFTAGTVTNSGTFLVPASSYNSTVDVTTFSNSGSFTVDGPLAYTLPASGSSLSNSGTLTVAQSTTLAVSSPAGNAASFNQSGVVDNNGSFTVAAGLEISGGSICGSTPYVGSGDGGTGGALTFASTVATGPACGTGVTTDSLFVPNVTATITGTIPAAYTVTIGDGGASFGNVTLSSVVNKGTLSFGWGATLTGPLANKGTFEVPSSTYTSTWDTSGFTNDGTTTVDGNLTLQLATTSSTLDNASGASLTVDHGYQLAVASPSGQTGTFVQDGLITNDGSLTIADALQVNGGTICANSVYSGAVDGGAGGTLAFAATPAAGPSCTAGQPVDQIFVPNVTGTISTNIPTGWTVTVGDGGASFAHVTFDGTVISGTLVPGYGATLTDASAVTVDGTLEVPASSYTTVLDLGGLTNAGAVSIYGNATITLPSGQSITNNANKKFIVYGGTTAVTGNIVNDGKMGTAAGAYMTVSGTFHQPSTGLFGIQIGSSAASARLEVTGTATIAGTVDILLLHFTPTDGEQFTVLDASSVTGTFSRTLGTLSISYTPTSVVATAS